MVAAPQPRWRHSDGLVPTEAQRRPWGQPHRRLAALSPPCACATAPPACATALDTSGSGGGGVGVRAHPESADDGTLSEPEVERSREALAACLEPGIWLSAETPWRVDHGRSRLAEGSPPMEHALRVLLPAICKAQERRRRSLTPLQLPIAPCA